MSAAHADLCLVADDLTGALDSAAQFTGRLGPVPVALAGSATLPSGSLALDLNCRDGAEGEAVRRARATASQLAAAAIAFKKIDSLLRGHWAAELAAIVELSLFDRIVLAPAFPAQGRITRNGRQLVRADHEGWTELSIDPAAELRHRGIHVGDPQATLGASALICDAADDRDLAALVETLMPASGRTLWCGSAGLARALAGTPPVAAEPPVDRHLVVVGSDHAVSRAQIERVRRTHDACVIRYVGGPEGEADGFNRVLAEHGRAVAIPDLPPKIKTADATERIARALAAILPPLRPPATLTVVGGETFAAVCRTLGTTVLTVEGEWRPGIPTSRMTDGAWAGTRCISKSGAFGDDALMLDLLGLRTAA